MLQDVVILNTLAMQFYKSQINYLQTTLGPLLLLSSIVNNTLTD